MPDTVIDLGDAMRKNPHLKVFSANGWFDLATPFFSTEHDIAQMMLPPSIASNVQFGYYPAGHMVYLNVEALKEFHADLEQWYPTAVEVVVTFSVVEFSVRSASRLRGASFLMEGS